MINIPIVDDRFDIRIAGEWTKRNGYSFNDVSDASIDGRDLWSGRVTIGWKPTSDLQTYLVWEHFSEDDDRLRSAKQLCTPIPIPTEVAGVPVGKCLCRGNQGDFLTQVRARFPLFAGCVRSARRKIASLLGGIESRWFPAPNGSGFPGDTINPYAGTTQSTNLRVISSELNPTYKAKNDTLEFNADYNVTPSLNFTSQTGYNQDFLWSAEDYDRFASTPVAYQLSNLGPGVDVDGKFCDPQLGCSSRLEAEDLDEHAWQFSQEFRLASNFWGLLTSVSAAIICTTKRRRTITSSSMRSL